MGGGRARADARLRRRWRACASAQLLASLLWRRGVAGDRDRRGRGTQVLSMDAFSSHPHWQVCSGVATLQCIRHPQSRSRGDRERSHCRSDILPSCSTSAPTPSCSTAVVRTAARAACCGVAIQPQRIRIGCCLDDPGTLRLLVHPQRHTALSPALRRSWSVGSRCGDRGSRLLSRPAGLVALGAECWVLRDW